MLIALMGCSHGSGDGEPTLRVAVASSVKTAAEEISLEFSRQNPGVRVEIAAGASGSLGVKIREGAPFDVFLAADEDTPQRLVQAGALDRESVRVYARGRLTLWTRAESPQAAIDDPLMAIRDPRVRNIAIASPRLAPYGRAAESFLEQAGLFDAIGTKVAIADNAEQAAQFALTGAADLAFIPRSLVLNLGERGRSWPLDDDAYPPILHAGGVVAHSTRVELAMEFLAFMHSPEGQAILDRHGLGKE